MKTTTEFTSRITLYQQLINDDIAAYSKKIKQSTLQNYGKNARLEIDAFLDILSRGGKRIRGALTMVGYEMSGGKNDQLILEVARCIEMIHAYILIIDDIQDKSIMRRGGKSAHVALAAWHSDNELAGDSDHFGVAIALNAALSGLHAAHMLLANIDTDPQLRLNVMSILNRTMFVTAHGQTNDIMNEVVANVTNDDVQRVLEWKTAHYSFLNPLHVGMVLAGADCHATDAITDYAMHVGKAFQITDDVIGTFGSEQETGKSSMEDIKEGKRTILSVHALNHAKTADKNFLIQMLGNERLTPAEYQRVKDIFQETDALEHSQNEAKHHVEEALRSLELEKDRWSRDGVVFLQGMAEYILARTS